MKLETDGYSFTLGPLTVKLKQYDTEKERVCIQLKTDKITLEIWVSKNGRVSIIDDKGNEWRAR